MMRAATGDGIKFGERLFSEPQLLAYPTGLRILDWPGLYVVLAYDANWRPRQFRPLYFGESRELLGRATTRHEKYPSWQAEAGLKSNLFHAFCFLPGSTRFERQMAENALIDQYTPPCNKRASVNLAAVLGQFPR